MMTLHIMLGLLVKLELTSMSMTIPTDSPHTSGTHSAFCVNSNGYICNSSSVWYDSYGKIRSPHTDLYYRVYLIGNGGSVIDNGDVYYSYGQHPPYTDSHYGAYDVGSGGDVGCSSRNVTSSYGKIRSPATGFPSGAFSIWINGNVDFGNSVDYPSYGKLSGYSSRLRYMLRVFRW